MPTLTVSNEIYDRLAKRAAVLDLTVEQLVAPLLELAAIGKGNSQPAVSASESCFDDWKQNFDAWMADVQGRAHRYPPGFVMDDSRASIYEGCGE